MGLCPAGPAQGAPPLASPAPALPIPARHGPSFRFTPLTLSQSHNSTHIMLCAQIRGGLDELPLDLVSVTPRDELLDADARDEVLYVL